MDVSIEILLLALPYDCTFSKLYQRWSILTKEYKEKLNISVIDKLSEEHTNFYFKMVAALDAWDMYQDEGACGSNEDARVTLEPRVKRTLDDLCAIVEMNVSKLMDMKKEQTKLEGRGEHSKKPTSGKKPANKKSVRFADPLTAIRIFERDIYDEGEHSELEEFEEAEDEITILEKMFADLWKDRSE